MAWSSGRRPPKAGFPLPGVEAVKVRALRLPVPTSVREGYTLDNSLGSLPRRWDSPSREGAQTTSSLYGRWLRQSSQRWWRTASRPEPLRSESEDAAGVMRAVRGLA